MIPVSEGSNGETPNKLANKTNHGHQALGLLERPWLNKVEGQSEAIRPAHTTHAYPYTCVRTHTKTCIRAHSHHAHIHTQLVKGGGTAWSFQPVTGVVVHACNLSTQEAGAGRSGI